jgi:hypothetical protein
VGVDEAVLDFLFCTVGRLAFVSFRTEGALVCRVSGVGTTVEHLDDMVVSFGWFIFVFEAALSALRRAGFFLSFLLGVVLEGWRLAVVATASVGTAMSIYLREFRCSTLGVSETRKTRICH